MFEFVLCSTKKCFIRWRYFYTACTRYVTNRHERSKGRRNWTSNISFLSAVSLNCNNTVSATAGENVTLNCSITSTFGGKVCTGQKYDWHNTNGNKLCETDATKYTCAWDALTYVSLTISNVQEEANVTAEIVSICGMVKSLPVRVQLIIGECMFSSDIQNKLLSLPLLK